MHLPQAGRDPKAKRIDDFPIYNSRFATAVLRFLQRIRKAHLRIVMNIQTWELLSYMVTVFGLPVAMAVFLFDKRKERIAEEEEVYAALANSYQDFLRLAIENADLRLMSKTRTDELNPEQRERMRAIFGLLIALFERAYLLLYDTDLTGKDARRWRSWEDFMQEWCGRDDFREAIPELLLGEDPEFASYIRKLAEEMSAQ